MLPSLVDGASLKYVCNPHQPRRVWILWVKGDETVVETSASEAIISPLLPRSVTRCRCSPRDGVRRMPARYRLHGLLRWIRHQIPHRRRHRRRITRPPSHHGCLARKQIKRRYRRWHGPYDTSLGGSIHSQFHLTTACCGRLNAVAPYSPTSPCGFLYPELGASPRQPLRLDSRSGG